MTLLLAVNLWTDENFFGLAQTRRGILLVGSGRDCTEEPAVGVGPVTLAVGVVPACPPGPRISASSVTS